MPDETKVEKGIALKYTLFFSGNITAIFEYMQPFLRKS